MDAPMGSTAQAPATAIPSATQHPGAQLLANQQPYFRMFVRRPWNHRHQHQRHYRGSFRRQGGNHHHTFAPRPLLFQQENSTHNMLVPFQRPRNPPLLLQQSADLTHQPGNIHHPPARFHHNLHLSPNQPTNISHQLAHFPCWRAHINPREAGVPQRFTHHLHQLSYHPHQPMNLSHHEANIPPQQANLHLQGSHTQHQLTVPPYQEACFQFQQANIPQGSNILHDPVNLSQHIYQRSHELPHQSFAERAQQYSHHQAHEHSHLSPHPTHVTYQSDFSPMQGQIPGYQETASTHSSNPSSMRAWWCSAEAAELR
ncbi:hypothetical protein GJAV_G00007280 [Gymnothorax javanicus]|nr:hypothetical protein GJAV_G00007280 [Gymnothorax javanicus]